MVTRTITILQHMLQNCYCACVHFTLSGVKVLKYQLKVIFLTWNNFRIGTRFVDFRGMQYDEKTVY